MHKIKYKTQMQIQEYLEQANKEDAVNSILAYSNQSLACTIATKMNTKSYAEPKSKEEWAEYADTLLTLDTMSMTLYLAYVNDEVLIRTLAMLGMIESGVKLIDECDEDYICLLNQRMTNRYRCVLYEVNRRFDETRFHELCFNMTQVVLKTYYPNEKENNTI